MWECKHCGWLREDEPKESWETCPNCDNFNWMRQGERNNIKWTTTPPTQEGWYWAKYRSASVPGIFYLGSEMEIPLPENRGYASREDFTHWLGPIPPPEPPQ